MCISNIDSKEQYLLGRFIHQSPNQYSYETSKYFHNTLHVNHREFEINSVKQYY